LSRPWLAPPAPLPGSPGRVMARGRGAPPAHGRSRWPRPTRIGQRGCRMHGRPCRSAAAQPHAGLNSALQRRVSIDGPYQLHDLAGTEHPVRYYRCVRAKDQGLTPDRRECEPRSDLGWITRREKRHPADLYLTTGSARVTLGARAGSVSRFAGLLPTFRRKRVPDRADARISWPRGTDPPLAGAGLGRVRTGLRGPRGSLPVPGLRLPLVRETRRATRWRRPRRTGRDRCRAGGRRRRRTAARRCLPLGAAR